MSPRVSVCRDDRPHAVGDSAAPLVDLPSVSDLEHENEQFIVVDLVDDAVVAGPDPPLASAADESGRGGGSRLVGEQIQRCLEASADLRVVFA
jgi:hypothetical protein